MKRRSFTALILTALTLTALFSGCSFDNGVEGLLEPPQLNSEQTAIKAALTETVGKSISLIYPKGGDFRSAYVVANIDGEPTDEAIVFYKPDSTKNSETIRVNILDQINGKWVSVYDHAGAGTGVDQIILERLEENSVPAIIISYTTINQNEKIVRAYFYRNSILEQQFSESCSALELFDIYNEGYNDLILIYNSYGENGMAKCRVIKQSDSRFSFSGETDMQYSTVGYSSVKKGKSSADIPAVFVDTAMGNGNVETQIIYSSNGELKNPLIMMPEIMQKTERPAAYSSTDADNDGIIEIPTLTPFPGYETADINQRVYMTDWWTFERLSLIKKNTGYYDINKGYCFMIPSRWKGTVTMIPDYSTDDVVFYKYSGSLNSDEELMRICAVSSDNAAKKVAEGFYSVVSNNGIEYMVKVPEDSDETLILTTAEIKFNFIVLGITAN